MIASLNFRLHVASMKSELFATAVMISAFACPMPASAASPLCPGFDEHGSRPEQVDQFYAMRAIDILRAGTSENRQALDQLVAPSANFSIEEADSLWNARGGGTSAAIRFAKALKATGYQFRSNWSMLLVSQRIRCEWSVSVMFATNDRDSSVVVDYKFEDGHLVYAKGQRVRVVQGQIP